MSRVKRTLHVFSMGGAMLCGSFLQPTLATAQPPRGEFRDSGPRPDGDRGPSDGDRGGLRFGGRGFSGRGFGSRGFGGPPPGASDGRRGGGPPPEIMIRLFPVMNTLDSDNDGEISASEIEDAPAALKRIDRNGDGKLTLEEIQPTFRSATAGRMGWPDRRDEDRRPPSDGGSRGRPRGDRPADDDGARDDDRPEGRRPETNRGGPAAESDAGDDKTQRGGPGREGVGRGGPGRGGVGRGGPGRGGVGRGGPGRGGPGRGGPERGGPERGGPGGGEAGRGGPGGGEAGRGGPGRGGPGDPRQFFSRMFEERDKNGDGKLSGDEIPSQMAARLERIDSDGDKAVTRQEMQTMMERTGSGSGGGRTSRGRGRGGADDRPGGQVPRRPEAE